MALLRYMILIGFLPGSLTALVFLLTILTQNSFADTTWVRGGNQRGVWDVTGSPFVLNATMTIRTGDTLIISQGVEVRFNCRCQIEVHGRLVVLGTTEDSVRFTTHDPSPSAAWHGIRFFQSNDTSIIRYAIIEKGLSSVRTPQFDHWGGGIYADRTPLVLEHCSFRNNSATDYQSWGGAFAGRYCSPMFSHCDFIGNYCYNNGGAVAVTGDELNAQPSFDHCAFLNNRVSLEWDFSGGAGYFFGSAPDFRQCTFKNNMAADGGALLVQGRGGGTFYKCSFDRNECTNSGWFRSGAVTAWMTTLYFDHCSFTRHIGGTFECSEGSVHFTRCSFRANRLSAVYVQSGQVEMNSTIVAETEGIGIIYPALNYTPAYDIIYSDFYKNIDGNFTGIVPDGLEVLNATNGRGDSCDLYNNIFIDPEFDDNLPNINIEIAWISPCRDAGDAKIAFDPDNTIADIGSDFVHRELQASLGAPLGRFTIYSPYNKRSYNGSWIRTLFGWTSCMDGDIGERTTYILKLSAKSDTISIPANFNVSFAVGADTLASLGSDSIIWWVEASTLWPPMTVRSDSVFVLHRGVDAISYSFELGQNFPNPFNSSTSIPIEVPNRRRVWLQVFNSSGQIVRELWVGDFSPGRYNYELDLSSEASGSYFCRLRSQDLSIDQGHAILGSRQKYTETRQITLLR